MSLPSKTLFNEYLSLTSKPLSSYHYSALAAWEGFFKFEYEIIDGCLCVFAFQGKDSFLYLPPLGANLRESTIRACFARMGQSRIARIENISHIQLPSVDTQTYNVYTKSFEYLYRRTDLIGLKGGAYKSKRHDIHVFLNKNPKAIFRPLMQHDLKSCELLYAQWSSQRALQNTDAIFQQMLRENKQVHQLILAQVDDWDLLACVVEIDGQIVGYSVGYHLNPDTFCILLEIVDLTKAGLAAFIFNRFCKDEALRETRLVNTMDDFGLPNIARAKESYHPVEKLPIYTITLKG